VIDGWKFKVPIAKHDFVERRASWVLEEAQSANGMYDQAIARISNFACFGEDLSSEGVKRRNTRITSAAYADFMTDRDFKRWHKMTTNEHQKELSFLFEEIKRDHSLDQKRWNAHDLLTDLHLWPMTTMLKKAEANTLPRKSPPLLRYANVTIEINIVKTPWDIAQG
jgi:hypothetical protein